MAMMLDDLIKQTLGMSKGKTNDAISKTPREAGQMSMDSGIKTPSQMQSQAEKPPAGTITNDAGSILDYKPGNPFSHLLDGKPEQGTIFGFLNQLGLLPNPVDVGSATSTSDAVMNKQPLAEQKHASLAPSIPANEVPLPQPRPAQIDYSQPSALDPVAIEQLRQSLLSDAGQLDPANPNGLSGRMNSPMSESDSGTQRNEAMGIEDSIRGFDGGTKPRKVP